MSQEIRVALNHRQLEKTSNTVPLRGKSVTCGFPSQRDSNTDALDSGHNGHKPKRPKPKRPQTVTATDRNGHNQKRPQTGTATNRNGHKPKRPQTGTATNRNGHKPERPQTGKATNRNRHNYIWFSGLQICVLNRSFKLVSRSRQK